MCSAGPWETAVVQPWQQNDDDGITFTVCTYLNTNMLKMSSGSHRKYENKLIFQRTETIVEQQVSHRTSSTTAVVWGLLHFAAVHSVKGFQHT